MKQRITEAQLNNLTDEQKQRLLQWWNPNIGDWYYYPKIKQSWIVTTSLKIDIDRIKENNLPLLSIGQMIQFIQEKKPQLKGISKNRFDKWFVNLDTGMLGYKDELCDALWEAVRQILKESAV